MAGYKKGASTGGKKMQKPSTMAQRMAKLRAMKKAPKRKTKRA